MGSPLTRVHCVCRRSEEGEGQEDGSKEGSQEGHQEEVNELRVFCR